MKPRTPQRHFFLSLTLIVVTSFAATTSLADPAPATTPLLRDAFSADDIDWDQTAEIATNPPEHNHPNVSYHEGVLRAIGLIAPDGDGLMAHWAGGWWPGGPPGFCRLTFKKPVAIGTIVQGASWMSTVPTSDVWLLKPDAPYPGDVTDESQWIKVEPSAPKSGATLYVPPASTVTRAVRHKGAGDMRFLAGRYENVVPRGTVVVSGGDAEALRHDAAWSVGRPEPISAQRPEWIVAIWDQAQTIDGLLLTRPVFKTFEVSYFAGAAEADPLSAPADQWKTVRSVTIPKPWRTGNQSYVPFDAAIKTTAVRVRIVEPFDQCEGPEGPAMLTLRGFVALSSIGDAPARTASSNDKPIAGAGGNDVHAPIPIRFTLPEAGFVTLAIDDADGRRVRNLIAEAPFPAGESVAWWDGLDETLQLEPRVHGVYTLAGRLVQPGAYRVRGLWRKKVELKYEMSVYTGGNPSWFTPDGSGGWLADESVPSAICFLPDAKRPQVLVGSLVAEAGHGLAWLNLDGTKRFGIRGTGAGGGWCGALHLARDAGKNAVPGIEAYLDAPFNDVLDLWTVAANGQHRKLYTGEIPKADQPYAIGGLAAHDGVLAVTYSNSNLLRFIDATTGAVIGDRPLENPRGLAFDAQGRLLALSGKSLVRLDVTRAAKDKVTASDPQPIVTFGLEDPQQIALDAGGNFYVSDQGKSHQVKVFAPDGKPLRTIGTAGGPIVGPYDETRMFNPAQLTISDDGHLWVAEATYCPKRISVWTLDGKFVRAMYGPSNYGGAGAIDAVDPSLMFINSSGGGTLQYRLDWKIGSSRLESVCFLHDKGPLDLGYTPQFPLVVDGRRYLTNLYTEGETNGEGVAFFWTFKDGRATPCAAVGNLIAPLREDRFRSRWPEGLDLSDQKEKSKNALCAWADANGDGLIQPDEVRIAPGGCGALNIDHQLAVTSSDAIKFTPEGFTACGAPIFDPAHKQILFPKGKGANTSGGSGGVSGRNGWTVMLAAPEGFPYGYVYGAQNGKMRWSYPCESIGLHASASAPLPRAPGWIIGITHLIGPIFTPRGVADDIELWTVNANKGNIYLTTTDGLFAAQLFKDERLAKPWPNKAERGADLTDCTLLEEDFLPTINQTADGNVYVVCRHAQSVVVRVDGLDTIRRLPDADLAVTPELLAQASSYFAKREAQRLANRPPDTLTVAIRSASPTIDGKLDDWSQAQWVQIDDAVKAAVTVAGDRLYAAFATGQPALLNNPGTAPMATTFKGGGALDLMIGADPSADPKREHPVAGDQRLLVTTIKGKPLAVLYRPVVAAGEKKESVQFTSPVKSFSMDRVDDVTSDLQFASAPDGSFELSIPLSRVGLAPKPGMQIRADLGFVRGDGAQAIQRIYWHNKMTGTVSDIPSEAELMPSVWGGWRFVGQ